MNKPTVNPEQIAGDAYYFATSKNLKASAVGRRVRMLHNISDFGKVHVSQRWHRIWIKTENGWKYEGLQFGREPLVK
jgi:hypothetical protein